MLKKYGLVALLIGSVVSLASGSADAAKKSRRHHAYDHHGYAPRPHYDAAQHHGPRRMGECVTDEGGGRLKPCSSGHRCRVAKRIATDSTESLLATNASVCPEARSIQ